MNFGPHLLGVDGNNYNICSILYYTKEISNMAPLDANFFE